MFIDVGDMFYGPFMCDGFLHVTFVGDSLNHFRAVCLYRVTFAGDLGYDLFVATGFSFGRYAL
jgi:hypothetical protein